jgi:hypothetical protein
MKKILPLLLAFAFLLVANTASAVLYWDYDSFEPVNGFSVSNGTTIEFSVMLEANGSDVINGTLCITVDTDRGIGGCGLVGEGGSPLFEAGLTLPFNPASNASVGAYHWRANYTSNTSVKTYSDIWNWNLIFTNTVLMPIYPITNENVTGDNTDYIVNYTVDVYFPDAITSNRYVYFYAYNSLWFGTPDDYSERQICEYVIKANATNPVSSGKHRIGCENYMTTNLNTNYDELPYNNPKFWRAKLRIVQSQVDGANLMSDTGFQQYNYRINTRLANVYPVNGTVFCDETLYMWNRTWYDISSGCNNKAWHNQFISFTAYLNDSGCGGGNVSILVRNLNNASQKNPCDYIGNTNNSIDYWYCPSIIGTSWTNTTYHGSQLNYTAIHLNYDSTFACRNGSTYTTTPKELWYIIGIGAVPNVTSGFATFPIPINMTGFMPSLSTYWASFFNTTTEGGLMFIAIFFLSAMAVLLIINADIMAGMCIFIYGILVFIRIGYINVVIFWILLVLTILIIVYWVRKFLLKRT